MEYTDICSNTLFVTAGLVDEDADLPMDSPHAHFGFPHSIHPGGPGSPGLGAIGPPTSHYTHTLHPISRKEDDLGLTNLLAQVRFDRTTAAAAGQDYGTKAVGEGRWDEWSRSSRGEHGAGLTLGNGNFNTGFAVGGAPKTAPLFPSSASDPHAPPISFPISTPPPVDPATQALYHMTALQNLLGPMTKAAEEVEKLKKEVEMWKNDWHNIGEEKRGLERALNEAQGKANVVDHKAVGPPFSVVLIDGDGLIFQDTHLQTGYQGGLTAARKLLSSLPSMHSHASISPTSQNFGADIMLDTADTTVMGNSSKGERDMGVVVVNVFLNKSGLGQTLINAKIVSDWKAYNSFFEGLSAAHELISVIDVGPGKEAADAKIREHLRLYARNSQCEMIVLGASHDNGYANILSSLQTENRLSKLLLLKGYTDLAGQLRQYSSRVVTIPDLFRTTKVPLSFSSIAAQPATPIPAPKKTNKSPPTATTSSTPGDTPIQSPGSVEVFDWKEVSSGAKKSGAGGNKSGGGAAKHEGNKSEGKGGKKKKNIGNKRVYSVRQLDPRPCHTYYLSDRACRGDACEYAHNYDLNDEEIEDLRRLAKEMVCPYVKNNKCHYSEEDCVYGHFCPRGQECKFCRFYPLTNGHGELDG